MFLLKASGENHFLAVFSFRRLSTCLGLWLLACIGPIDAFIFTCLSSTLNPLPPPYRDPCDSIALNPPDKPIYSPHLKMLNHICEVPLPRKVTSSLVPRIRTRSLEGWGHHSAYHTLHLFNSPPSFPTRIRFYFLLKVTQLTRKCSGRMCIASVALMPLFFDGVIRRLVIALPLSHPTSILIRLHFPWGRRLQICFCFHTLLKVHTLMSSTTS